MSGPNINLPHEAETNMGGSLATLAGASSSFSPVQFEIVRGLMGAAFFDGVRHGLDKAQAVFTDTLQAAE